MFRRKTWSDVWMQPDPPDYEERNHLDMVAWSWTLEAPRIPSERLHAKGVRRTLRKALGTLSVRRRRIIEKLFGFDTDLELTAAEIGNALQMSPGRVWQLKKEALKQLRHQLKGKLVDLGMEDARR